MHDDRPSTVTAPSPATLFVALDLSRSSWVVAVHAPHTGKVGRHKLAPGAEGLLALIERMRTQAEHALGAPVRVASCYEAGRDGFWLHRVLLGAGIENRVIDPASLLVDRRARRAKTDRLDAEALLRALMALCRGEPRVCAVVRAPSVEEEDARRTTRSRSGCGT
jgi:transposase